MNTTRGISMLAAIAAVTLAVAPLGAQATAKPATAKAPAAKPAAATAMPAHETPAQLKTEAKVPEKTARATALAQVPGGRVTKHELERENGKLLYSYDIATKGKGGIDEVQVDAITGTLLSNKHETAAMEKAEAKADAKQHAARKASRKARHDVKKA
jgi:uncharacterized membrane protein YkoI